MATIKDIAQLTGVSCTTVSNVIHGRSQRVSAETIQRINDAINELGYTPNMSARSLVSHSSKVIGFIKHVATAEESNFIEDPFYSIFISIIERILRENGYYLMFRTIDNPNDLTGFLRNWNIDGLLFTGIFKDRFFDIISSLDIPVVLIDSYVHAPNICNIGLEDRYGSYVATQYLISKGHKRIAFAAPIFFEHGVMQERLWGYQDALKEANIPFDSNLVFDWQMHIDSCKTISDKLIAMPDVTAFVATSDYMATGVMAGLQEKHIRVPEDFSIIGFDDINMCQMVSPALTTIHQNMNEKASLAATMLLKKLEGADLPQSEIILPINLVERNSVRAI